MWLQAIHSGHLCLPGTKTFQQPFLTSCCTQQRPVQALSPPSCRAAPLEATPEPQQFRLGTPRNYRKQEEDSWLPSQDREPHRYSIEASHSRKIPYRLQGPCMKEKRERVCCREVRSFGGADEQQLKGGAGSVDLEANTGDGATQEEPADPEGPIAVVVDPDYPGKDSTFLMYLDLMMGGTWLEVGTKASH